MAISSEQTDLQANIDRSTVMELNRAGRGTLEPDKESKLYDDLITTFPGNLDLNVWRIGAEISRTYAAYRGSERKGHDHAARAIGWLGKMSLDKGDLRVSVQSADYIGSLGGIRNRLRASSLNRAIEAEHPYSSTN